MKKLFLGLLLVSLLSNVKAQVTDVDYWLDFDEVSCEYLAYLIVNTGSSTTIAERFHGSSALVLSTPKEMSVTSITSIAPTASTWDIGFAELEPPAYPDNNYYQIFGQVVTNPLGVYDPMSPGDTILLFRAQTSHDMHGSEGIQIMPLTTSIPYTNNFQFTAAGNILSGLRPQIPPNDYAETEPINTFIGVTQPLSPSIPGTWSNSNTTASSIAANGSSVTALAVGTSILTFTPNDNTICPSSTIVRVSENDPISEVDYRIVFNEAEGVYECNLIINEGAAISNTERIQLGSTYSVVVPKQAKVLSVEGVAPSNNPLGWMLGDSVLTPTSDPDFNFYQITTDGSPVELHDTLLPGDEITLFKLDVNYNFHAQDGMRNFINDVDLVGNPISIDNDLNIGAINDSYNGNLPITLPSTFLEFIGNDTIFVGGTTSVSPSSGGTYVSSDPAVATVDANGIITGVSNGETIITYTPSGSLNASSLLLVVQGSNPLTKVNYLIEFDSLTCSFNCSIIATEGNAISQLERLQGSATYSVVVPKDVSVSINSSINPPLLDWEFGEIYLEPSEDSLHNFYQITYNVGAGLPAYHNEIYQGDTVILFKLDLTSNTHGPAGIRNLINGQDLLNVPIGINNDFNIGGNSDVYQANETPISPPVYATAATAAIDIGNSTTVSPTSGGMWSTNGSLDATFDPATFTVTGQNPGCILMTFTPNNGCPSSVEIEIVNPPHDPVSEVDYQIKFNESTCEYECYAKIITGSALTFLERNLLGSSFSLVTPAEASLTFEESINPSPSAGPWYFSFSELSPSQDPEHNYYNIISSNSTMNDLGFLYPNDEVLLFTFSLDNNIHGPESVRIFDNVNDASNIVANMDNEFNLGSPTNTYRENIQNTYPAIYAESPSGTNLIVGQTISLTPLPSEGQWSSSNPNVAINDTNSVTIIDEGFSIMTFTPNDPLVCPSSIVLTATIPPHDPISEVEYLIRYNEDSCHYEAIFKVKTGSALTILERQAYSSTFTVVTPPEINISLKNSMMPENSPWMLGLSELSPATDPNKNFFQFLTSVNGADRFDFLYEADEVILFTFEADYDIHYSKEIRNYNNDGSDVPTVDIQNEFNIGNPGDQYIGNLPLDYPTSYADTTNTSSIYVGLTTTLSAPSVGNWSTNDSNIATVDATTGEVTGVAPGKVIITHTPTDNTECPSSVIIEVTSYPTLSEVEYILIWDEVNKEYVASMIAVTGNAISTNERLQLGSTFSIVTPSLVTPTIASVAPTSSTWGLGDQILEPVSDPLHNFFQITTDGTPVGYHDIILEGDTVELFRIDLDIDVHGSNGVRILENGVDLLGNQFVIDNDINIGAISGQYQNNAPTVLPTIFADTDTEYEIPSSTTTNVIPSENDGTWSNSNPSVATRDANGVVTGLTVGTTVLTFTPNNGNHPSSVIIYVTANQNSTVTAVDFKIEFDDSTCDTYNCYLIIKEGSAYSQMNLIQGNSTYSIVTPKDVTVTFLESITPNVNSWSAGDVSLSPPQDPLHNYFNFYPTLSGGSNAYDPLIEGDELLLFKVQVSSLAQGPKGIRLFDNDTDTLNLTGSFENGFTLGGVDEIYSANQEGIVPSNYAEATGPSDIIVGGQTALIPSTGGTWSNSNSSIASIDAENVVTGLSLGTAVFTFTPDPNSPSSCATQFSVNVIETPTTTCGIGLGTATPHPSALFEVYSDSKGILIPRMGQAQRLCIVSPANGLLVFQDDNNTGFYYFNGITWTRLDDTITSGSGTSGFQNDNSNNAMKGAGNDELESLKAGQAAMEQKLKDQQQLIKELTKKLNN